MTGTQVFRPDDARFDFLPGPLFHGLVLVDEINRAPPKVQSALLEAMAERQITAGGVTRPLPDPFMVVATQNSIEHEGTFPLPEAQLDRFLLHVALALPGAEAERAILELVEAEGRDPPARRRPPPRPRRHPRRPARDRPHPPRAAAQGLHRPPRRRHPRDRRHPARRPRRARRLAPRHPRPRRRREGPRRPPRPRPRAARGRRGPRRRRPLAPPGPELARHLRRHHPRDIVARALAHVRPW